MQTEIERKYDVDAAAAVPDLQGVDLVVSSVVQRPVSMKAVYYDTADRALTRGRITMRRRVGGEDEGWHVKLPGAKARTELHVPLTRSSIVPAEVRAPVLAFVGTEPLRRIARLNTTRTIVRLLDAGGAQLAELADDLVVAVDLRDATERRWREWEVELKDGAPGGDAARAELLDAIAERLSEAGAAPASSVSKLARATGRTGTERTEPTPPADGCAAALAAIEGLVAAIRSADPWVRLDTDDAVHRMRVLTRRLRSVLAASRSALDRGVTDPLRVELKWIAGLLGEARDAEVARSRIEQVFADVPGGEQARERMTAELDGRYTRAHRMLLRALRGRRYLALLTALDALVAAPPVVSERSTRSFVAKALAREARRVGRLTADADRSTEDRHELRKASKRLRYVGEALAATAPDAIRKREKSRTALAEDAADALGEERDGLALCNELLLGAARARRARADTFAYGAAWANARSIAEEAEGRAASVVVRLRDGMPRAESDALSANPA